MDLRQRALEFHQKNRGKIEIKLKAPINDKKDLSLAYTPGVAEACKEIEKDKEQVYNYTNKGNLVAVVTDGTAVLGLGDIGPLAAYPVMEGKAALFKSFANVDAIPICLNTTNVDEIVQTVKAIAPTFGGINLEDISSPRCFEIERKLIEELDIPVFHDDQHGTAIVVLAALINALKLVKKDIKNIKVVINGVGAAGSAIAKILLAAGVKNMDLVEKYGIIYKGAKSNNWMHDELASQVNPMGKKGNLTEALTGADVFIGVSRAKILTKEMVSIMNDKAIIFAMANPEPEIYPDQALAGGALVVGTGRSDFPNQINNVSVFPGLFKGALRAKAKEINEEMKLAAAKAIAGLIEEDKLNPNFIIEDIFNPAIVEAVAQAVETVAVQANLAKD